MDKRRAEKDKMEEVRRRENMDRLHVDMQKSKGGTVVLSTGLKREDPEEEEDEDEEVVEAVSFSEDEEGDEDEEVSHFVF